jgi:methylglyoxal/glyoxal reductase
MTIPTAPLNNGHTIPVIGLGLYLMRDRAECLQAVRTALDTGYRHFDSAQFYQNEAFLGEAIRTSSIPREDAFLTTKISNDNQAPGRLLPSFEQSINRLGYDYWDLLLLHFPVAGRRQQNWPLMEQIYHSGRARAIGVSNYTIHHLEELLATCEVKPAVNQVELHVYLQQPDLVKYCHEHNILIEAYSPLAHGHGLDNPVLADIARKHHKTPAQIMIRWCLEVDTVPLPKSSTPERIRQNLDVLDFQLDADDMAKIHQLERGQRTAWDPTAIA